MITNMEDMYSIDSPRSDLDKFTVLDNFQSFNNKGSEIQRQHEDEEETDNSCNFTNISEKLLEQTIPD